MQHYLKRAFSISTAVVLGAIVCGGTALFLNTSMPTESVAASKTLSGTVMFRERIALPPETSLLVELSDISLADAPSKVISSARINAIQGSPIPFALNFDAAKIQPGHRYALQARISAGDTLWFINDEAHLIDPAHLSTPAEVKVVMVRKGDTDQNASAIEGKDWLAEDIQGGGVIDNAQTTLTVADDGSVSGSAGCNRFMTKAVVKGDAVSFGPVTATYMQCPPALMTQERKFLDLLEKVRTYRIETGKLVLIDESGQELAKLARSL